MESIEDGTKGRGPWHVTRFRGETGEEEPRVKTVSQEMAAFRGRIDKRQKKMEQEEALEGGWEAMNPL